QTHLGESLGEATAYDIRNAFFDHVQRLSFVFHNRHHTGNLMSRVITDTDAIRMFVTVAIVRTPHFILLFVVVSIIMLLLDWQLGLIAITMMPLVAIFSAMVRIRLRRIWLIVMEDMAKLSTVLQENLTGARVVRAFASHEYQQGLFGKQNDLVKGNMIKAGKLQAVNGTLVGFSFLVIMGLILLYGGSRVIAGHMTPGELAQFFFYMQILTIPVNNVGIVVNSFARAVSAGQRMFEILDWKSDVKERPNPIEMPRVRGHVRFESVSFSYVRGKPVLKDITIDAPQGKVIALVGAPGSGKSTIVNLLARFYDVSSGRITIDGTDIRHATLKSLRRNIGLVQQDVFLFTASIRDNIAYGRHEATMEDVIEASKVAQFHDFVQTLEDGYGTVIGERGATLSGGQRQRLTIARAVLLDPPILVLDDSTSSVDAHTEELIRKAMDLVMRGRTTFVIAHRLGTVHRADEILVLKDGEIVERGAHDELLAQNGLYRNIYELQLKPQEDVMLEFKAPQPDKEGAPV
ncbi:MAG: ABC transporter ATP-binding protein/permease, partial [Chloroflexi bacterium]|nr:ABC transporter ATP-binding protein/permease [Chloroflexota bacterium]